MDQNRAKMKTGKAEQERLREGKTKTNPKINEIWIRIVNELDWYCHSLYGIWEKSIWKKWINYRIQMDIEWFIGERRMDIRIFAEEIFIYKRINCFIDFDPVDEKRVSKLKRNQKKKWNTRDNPNLNEQKWTKFF